MSWKAPAGKNLCMSHFKQEMARSLGKHSDVEGELRR